MAEETMDLKTALVRWAERHEVSPSAFARRMGYSYAHAWGLLRGDANVTSEMLGRFVVSFGGGAVQELLAEAGAQDEHSTGQAGVGISPGGGQDA